MKHISMDLIRVTEAAAVAASGWIGSGNKEKIDEVATNAMRNRLNNLDNFRGVVRIGEGLKDKAPGMFKGEKVGKERSWPDEPLASPWHDIAVDPVDGTTQTAIGGHEAMSVIAVADPGSMLQTEEHYMLKIAYGPTLDHICFDLRRPLEENLKTAALAFNKPIDKLTVCLLNRPRHQEYINRIRTVGCRIKLIQDCDISAAIATCRPKSGVDLLFGIGGAPEAVLTACAMKCMGGGLQTQVWNQETGKTEGEVFLTEDLVKGHCCFAATGVTDGSLLNGVRWKRGPATNSVFMRSESGTIRWVQTEHGN